MGTTLRTSQADREAAPAAGALETIIAETVRRVLREELGALRAAEPDRRIVPLLEVAARDLDWSAEYSAVQARAGRVPGAKKRGRRWLISRADWDAFLTSGEPPRPRELPRTKVDHAPEPSVIPIARAVEQAVERRARRGRR